MTTVLEFATTMHQTQLDAVRKVEQRMLSAATKVVEQTKGKAPKLPEQFDTIVAPLREFVGKPVDYMKYFDAAGADWAKVREQFRTRMVELAEEAQDEAVKR